MSSKKPEVRKDKSPRIYFILAGIVLIVVALAIPVSTFAPVFKAEVNYQLNKKNDEPVEFTPVDPEFSVIIPKINANAKVIKNVDPFDSKIYQQALTKGVAHAKGTSTPDKSGNVFIFAHSAGNWYQANQFNAVFYLLNKLEAGDEIIVYYQSQKYTYTVQETKLVKGDQTSYMSGNSNQNQLTLMTCWPPGTTLKRLVVIAIPKQ
jgi:sortase A